MKSRETDVPPKPRTSAERSPSKAWPSRGLRVLCITLATLLFPLVLYGAMQAWNHSGTRVEDWLPDGFEETQRLREFYDRFGSDELLMIGWPGLRLEDPQLELLRERLLQADSRDPEKRKFFDDVFTGDSILAALQDEPLELSLRQTVIRMRGWVLGKDRRTAAIALVSIDGINDRHAAVNFARRVVSDVTKRSPEEIHLAGPTIEVVAIDEASKSSLLRLNLYSFAVCIILLLLCIRRVFYAIVIFVIALYCEQGALALIHFSGGRLDSVLLLTASLAGVLSMSAAIHTFGYYRDALATPNDQSPAWRAFRRALLPTSLAALTTAIGFGSLAVSDVVPVRNFGIYSAIAAPLAVMLTLWYLPMYLSNKQSPVIKRPTRPLDFQQPPWYLRAWPIILSVAAIALIVGGMGASKLQTAVGLHDLFPSDAKVLRDYRWLEQEIGPLIPIEVVLDVPRDADASLLVEMQYVAILEAKLLEVDGIDSVLSALNFAPPIPTRRASHSVRGIAAAKVYESRLKKSLDQYESFRMLRQEKQGRAWRLSARVAGGIPQDYPPLLAQIDQATSAAIDEIDADVSVTISGGVPLAAKTQQQLLTDLGQSFLMAVLLIGLTMAVILKSPLAGIVTLVPNVAPALIVFGVMGWFGWPAEIGGIMTASAVLGIAVDDSLHMILAFRAAHAGGLGRQMAVLSAIRTCRPAIVQTSLVCGLGMLVFALSPFVPIQRFAWLMFTLLAIALAADLVLMPALLFSPIGRCFLPSRRSDCKD